MSSTSFKRILLSTVLISAMASPSFAAVNFDIDIGVAPPPVRYEVVPVARPGYVWAPGYWEWDDGRHVWFAGRWIEERPGYDWVADRWVHHGNHWGYSRGHWAADSHWDHNRDWHHDRDDHDNGDHGHDRDWGHDRH